MNDLVFVEPVSPLRQRLIEDMAMHRFAYNSYRNRHCPKYQGGRSVLGQA